MRWKQIDGRRQLGALDEDAVISSDTLRRAGGITREQFVDEVRFWVAPVAVPPGGKSAACMDITSLPGNWFLRHRVPFNDGLCSKRTI